MSDPDVMLDPVMSRRAYSPALVGRVAEMAVLGDALDAVR
jgi:hypothetical protein